jgi:hypothetical protein
MTEHRFVIAPKDPAASNDLSARLAAIEGVTVEGAFGGRALIRATPEALERVRGELAGDFHIEPLVTRRPLEGPAEP